MSVVRYYGLVSEQDRGVGVAGARVEAWDVDSALSDPVAIAVTGADGQFEMRIPREDVDGLFAGRQAIVAFRVISGTAVLASTDCTHRWNLRGDGRGRIEVNPGAPMAHTRTPPRLVVRGQLVDAATGPVAGATIQACDENVGEGGIQESALGSDTTDARGRYRISFDNTALGRAGKELPDLVVRALIGTNKVAEERVRAASPITEVVLIQNGTSYAGRGEHARLLEALDAHRGGVPWRSLSADQTALIAEGSRTERQAVDFLVSAAQMADAVPAVPAEAFYGLMRHGLPSSRVLLLSHRPNDLRKTLEKAIEAGTVSGALTASLDAIEAALLDAAVLASFEARPDGVGLGTILSRTPGVSTALQQSFVRTALTHEGDSASFWASIEADPAFNGHVPALRFTTDVTALVANHTAMLDHLHTMRGNGDLNVASDLATQTLQQWQSIVLSTGVPAGVEGTSDADKRDRYAAWIKRTVETRFRTAVIAARITQAEPNGNLATFFAGNKAFAFEKQRVAHYLAENPAALAALPDADKTRLFTLERLCPITRSYEQMAALETAGLTSAYSIYKKGKTRFFAEHAQAVGGEQEASSIFESASWVVCTGAALLGKYSPKLQVDIPLLPSVKVSPEGLPNQVADWTTLFGTAGGCACDHCQSVYSPSAYLVDILQFLGRQPASAGSGRDLLFARRPDIAHLELSCNASDTPLPYVDLVHEILEIALAETLSPPVTWPTTPAKNLSEPDDLLAAPDVLYPEARNSAYTALANASYPFDVPFHVWAEEARIYLNHLGVPRHELIRVLSPDAATAQVKSWIAAERLGASLRQIDLVEGANGGPTLQELWGYAANESESALQEHLTQVSTFLKRAGLTFDELRELLASGLYTSLALPNNDGCDVSSMVWGAPSISDLTQLHRFLRLRKLLGWSITDMGKAVTALGPIDAGFVEKIATLEHLRGPLGMDVPAALSLFADIDRNGAWAPSLFERLFLRRNVANADDNAFAGVFGAPSGTPAPVLPLLEHRSAILAAVGGADADLSLLLDPEAARTSLSLRRALDGVAAGAADLTLQNLSRIHRIFALARGAGLSVRDYLALLALWGQALLPGDVLAGGAPESLEAFLDVARRVRESRLSISELHYIARHVVGPNDTFAPTSAQVDLLLAELTSGVKAATAEAGRPGAATTEKVKKLLHQVIADSAQLTQLEGILDGSTALTRDGQLDAIGPILLPFVDNTEDARRRLVGQSANDSELLPAGDARYSYLARRILRADEAFVKQAFSAALGLSPKVVERLLSPHVLPSTDHAGRGALHDFLVGADLDVPAGSEGARRAHVLRLHKAALLLGRLRFSQDEALALFPESGVAVVDGLPWLNLASLPVEAPEDPASVPDYAAYLAPAASTFDTLLRFINLAALRDRWPAGRERLFAFVEQANTPQPPDLVASLSEQLELPSADVTALIQRFWDSLNVPLGNERALGRIDAARTVLRSLGASAADAIRWTALDTPLPDLQTGEEGALAVARDIKQAVRAKYAPEAWSAVARPLRDELRERQRKALVGYLMARKGHARVSALYEDLLIDVEMSPCMMTSRTVQAVAAAQLFVQRSLLHLEQAAPGVPFTLGEEAALEWEWMKSYRVWEANRKVFLYPENWLEPELRDDKTPLFRALESRLSQGPLTHEAAEKAFRTYLEELHEISHLDIVALAEQVDGPADPYAVVGSTPKRTVHVFGRTRSPNTYYYRAYAEGRFTPWEKIDLDLPDDYLVPVVHGGRLFLFWPVINERGSATSPGMMTMSRTEEQKIEYENTVDDKNAKDEPPPSFHVNVQVPPGTLEEPSPKRLGMTFAYVERQQGKFMKKRHAKDASVELPFDIPGTEPVPPGTLKPLFFLGRSDGTGISIDCCTWEKINTKKAPSFDYNRFATFSFSPCAPSPKIIKRYDSGQIAVPQDTKPSGQYFAGAGDLLLVSEAYPSAATHYRLFKDMERSFSLVVARANEPSPLRNCVVFKDEQRTFLVERRLREVTQEAQASKFTKIGALSGWVVNQPPQAAQTTFEEVWFRATALYHPLACSFLTILARSGLDGLMRWAGQTSPVQLASTDIEGQYHPDPLVVETPFPREEVDFSAGGGYSVYNWEIFFHAPLLIAARLDLEQRYDEADRWYRYIFDPADGSSEPAPARYWKVRPFYENQDVTDLLTDLTAEAANAYAAEMGSLVSKKFGNKASDDFASQVSVWRSDPFNPYAIARTRPIAFQKATVLRYIDHLLKWGDTLFRRDTRESVAEATQLYMYASNLLGPRPTIVPNPNPPVPKTYDMLQALDTFSNALVNVESIAPSPAGWGPGGKPSQPPPDTVWGTLYFCLPPNDKLVGLWDVVEDRLFKIRHCMNIEGTRRDLALFDAPIDPAILVRARAAGVDIESVLADLYAPAPVYRFSLLHARAVELTGYLTSLGAGLLSALEKRDAEHLVMLRSNHEIQLAQAIREVKKRQIDEAEEQVSALERSRAVVEERRRFYAEIPKRIEPENQQFTKIDLATAFQVASQSTNATAAALAPIPDTRTITAPPCTGGSAEMPGGSMVYRIAQLVAGGLAAASHIFSQEGTKHGIEAGYKRREAEWDLQRTLAERELAQIDKQIAAAQIRVAIAEHDLDVHERSMDQMREVREHLQDKFTNEELYDWYVGQTSILYSRAYHLAYQMAKRAEKAYRYERGDQNDTFIGFDAWDGLRKGLLAGERLSLDLRRMESAYLEKNRREYEITKHVSLASHAPEELLRLREEGVADIRLEEADYDRDHPTHYMRRLKTVSVTVPCVTGPYQGVNGKLTLLHGEARTSMTGNSLEATRGAIQSIITSSGQNDSGMFELALRDDRLLPFEGAGAQAATGSTGGNFRFDLPPDQNRFDFDSISDLILTVRYTARDGRAAPQNQTFSGKRLFSARQDFADAWQAFVESPAQGLVLAFAPRMFARPQSKKTVKMTKLRFYTKKADGTEMAPAAAVTVSVPNATSLDSTTQYGSLKGWMADKASQGGVSPASWTLSVTDVPPADLADLWIIVDYNAS